MPELSELDNTFREILIAAKRAEQLISGARPRIASRLAKPTTIALAELQAGLVPWRPVTAEEYELLRQEELTVRDKEDLIAPILAVPRPEVAVAEVPELEEEELDEFEENAEAPDFDAAELGDVEIETAVPEELLEGGE